MTIKSSSSLFHKNSYPIPIILVIQTLQGHSKLTLSINIHELVFHFKGFQSLELRKSDVSPGNNQGKIYNVQETKTCWKLYFQGIALWAIVEAQKRHSANNEHQQLKYRSAAVMEMSTWKYEFCQALPYVGRNIRIICLQEIWQEGIISIAFVFKNVIVLSLSGNKVSFSSDSCWNVC